MVESSRQSSDIFISASIYRIPAGSLFENYHFYTSRILCIINAQTCDRNMTHIKGFSSRRLRH